MLFVVVPENGYTETMDIDDSQRNGFQLDIIGIPFLPDDITYYIDDDIEFRVGDITAVTAVHNIAGIAVETSVNDEIGSKEYFVKNHLGSIVTTLGEDGNVVGNVYEYYSYGKQDIVHTAASVPDTETFTGKELDRYDEDIHAGSDGEGLYYFGARYYDPEVGIFTSTDPADECWNAYSYTGGNPISFIDPDGRKIVDYETGSYDAAQYEQVVTSADGVDFLKNFALDNLNHTWNDVYTHWNMAGAGQYVYPDYGLSMMANVSGNLANISLLLKASPIVTKGLDIAQYSFMSAGYTYETIRWGKPPIGAMANDFAGEGLEAWSGKMAEGTLGKRGGEIISGTIGLLWSAVSGVINDQVSASKK